MWIIPCVSLFPHRSVQDELARESMSDAPTVLLSYVAMLLYIAVALGALPPSRRQALQVFVLRCACWHLQQTVHEAM